MRHLVALESNTNVPGLLSACKENTWSLVKCEHAGFELAGAAVSELRLRRDCAKDVSHLRCITMSATCNGPALELIDLIGTSGQNEDGCNEQNAPHRPNENKMSHRASYVRHS